MYDVVCVGILCADVLVKPVNELPEKGKLNFIDDLSLQIGGCASNAAIDLVRMGINTTIIGKVGKDSFGHFIIEGIKKECIDISGLKLTDIVQPSASVVTISKEGERSILHCLGSNSRFSFEDIDTEIIKNSKLLFVGGTFLMPAFDGNGTIKLLKFSRENGIISCMDTAWDTSGTWMSKIENCLEYLDWFIPSYEEAVKLTGKKKIKDIAEVFVSKGVQNVVIKLGEKGCFVKPLNQPSFYSPAFDLEVIDTSGAGDAFCAGFITGLIKGWNMKKCAKFANAAGAKCIGAIGTTTGIKSKNDILELLDNKLSKRSNNDRRS